MLYSSSMRALFVALGCNLHMDSTCALCKLSGAIYRSLRRMALRRGFLILLEVVRRNFLGKSSVEIARCETGVFVGGVSRVAEFRPWRWARATVLFASGRAWRSKFRNLRHPPSENVISGAGVREPQSIVFEAPEDLRACEIDESIEDSAET